MTTADPEQTGLVSVTPGSRARALGRRLGKAAWRTARDEARAVREVRPRTWWGSLRQAMDRPLTSYYLLLGSSVLLVTIGLIMVLSASSVYSYETHDGNSYAIVQRQLEWALIGLPAAFVASRLPTRWLRRLAYPGYLISLGLLALTAVFGHTVNGNQNWLGVGSLSIQPSEVAKLGLVLWAAHVYANKERRLDQLHHILVPVVPGFVLASGLVLLGNDLGTALVLFAMLLGFLWAIGAPGRLFTLAFAMLGVAALVLASTSPERVARITSFVNPLNDVLNTDFQPVHGLFALSTGGLFGQGIGASQQKWGTLPEAHTDFIFAVLGEELGLAGTLLVIALFLTIAFAALRVARRSEEPFVRYLSFGIVVWILGQAMINIGMVLALLPVIGIPLPLVSYGGSSLVPSLVALGLLVGFARREPEAARALAQRRRTRSAGLSAGRAR